MQCKVGVVSIGKLQSAIRREVAKLNLEDSFVFFGALMYEGMEFPKQLEDVDILMSSGYNTVVLRTITSKPIINIEPSLFDILCSYSDAINFDKYPAIIFAMNEYSNLLEKIDNILSVSIMSAVYKDISELDALIQRFKSRGSRCIIGSGLACDEAEKAGMKSVFVYPSESLRGYVKLAYDTANSLHAKERENTFLSLALDNVKDGLMFTDEKGTILVCNPSARSIFSGSDFSNIIGENILNLTENGEIIELYRNFQPIKNIVSEFNGEKFVFTAYPLRIHNDISNMVLSFYSIQNIQSKERHIRNALSKSRSALRYTFEDIKSKNKGYQKVLERAVSYAKHDRNVLISGPSGCSKSVFAEAIHSASSRANNPFVTINCSATSDALLEAEMFGYEEVPYAGAKKVVNQGLLELAHNGTVFFDEITNLSLSTQAKVLRVLQEGQVVHVNSNKAIPCNVRVIAASTRNLWDAINEHKFNEALYYCLSVLNLDVPRLCDRPEDIFPLFISFAKNLNPVFASRCYEVSEELERVLCTYSWPGNIRELENFAHQMYAILTPYDWENTLLDDISREIKHRRLQRHESIVEKEPKTKEITKSQLLSEEERIRTALQEAGGNYSRAAAILNISRTTLWRKMKALGM